MKLEGEFFATARERHSIYLKRLNGRPRPWTEDPVLRHWRFCNVHRELDRTTAWLREFITDPLWNADPRKTVEAVIAFRWFNRIETGERIKDLLLGEWNTEEARRRLVNVEPVVSGAYIIIGKQGMSKMDGVLWCIDYARQQLPSLLPEGTYWPTLKASWESLKTLPYAGKFIAYEFVTDLRWTRVLKDASDINTWASAGPGCGRGLGWVVNGHGYAPFRYGTQRDQDAMLVVMRELLEMSRDTKYWPDYYPEWEMREVEHWACEFDKYKRAQRGDRMKRRFA